ncbi:MAG: sigma-54 dependent transcriptional regulator, partial [Victivallales bacterium]|nr:sigma-54 dependent transcriptional regulator [Victivallales bacterium]
MSKKTILLVEDNLLVSTAVQDILRDEGFAVAAAETGKAAGAILQETQPALVLLDMMLPDVNGQQLLERWRKKYPGLPVIIMTAHGDIPTAVECLRAGAYDFLTKPVEKPLLLKTIKNALDHVAVCRKVNVLSQLTSRDAGPEPPTDVVAQSPAMTATFELLKMVAASDFSCLLITGESGTGKGLLAKTVHRMGNRAGKPFVEVNCSALPATLIESELFGHRKGAFTDAKEEKIGLFEMADTGTLFLDEIGDMDVKLQAKLLKVIEDQTFRRIGSTEDIKVDVSIIAATNQDLETQVRENRFRNDLYYRLNVIPIQLPPLRERAGDIKPMAEHFLRIYARKFGKKITGFSPEVFAILQRYDWPGNVREFRNVIERSCILTRGEIIDNPAVLFPGSPAVTVTEQPESLPAASDAASEAAMTSHARPFPAMPLA